MKNLKLYKLIFFMILSSVGLSQGEFNNWHFGTNAHLDFNPTTGVISRPLSSLNTLEGCASISDGAGNLLFYTDGITVWDNTNGPMTNGGGLGGNPSSTTSAIIVPRPGNNSQYYIFSVDFVTGANGIEYSIVDMNIGANGAVTATKNVSLISGVNVSEKLSIVRHANCIDYWIVAAMTGTSTFRIFRLTNGGIVTPTNTTQIVGTNIITSLGVMKHSPDGSRLGVANLDGANNLNSNVYLYNFDNATGNITMPTRVDNPGIAIINGFRGYYGLEFSPNRNFLYFTDYHSLGRVFQASINPITPATIISTTRQSVNALQLTPELPQRIFVAGMGVTSLSVINDPDNLACNFTMNTIPLTTGTSQRGLPGFISGLITKDSSDYCCDNSPNLIRNGNFEAGNVWFTTGTYTHDSTPMPAEYYVGTRADALGISLNWIAEDHSNCNLGVSNNQFMMVNGRTQQATSTVDIIWESTIPNNTLDPIEGRFCANFRHLPQCTFDVTPIVELQIGSNGSGWTTLSTIAANQCDWENISMTGTLPPSSTTNLRIVLQVDGNGDGNDLAIDDISFQEFAETNAYITVQNNGGSNTVTASVYDLTNADDTLSCDSSYSWYVEEITSWTPTYTFTPGTQARGNMSGSEVPPSPPSSTPWNLTTTFPGYTFANNKMYVIAFYQPENADCCQGESLTYQLILNSRTGGVLSEADKQRIIDYIKNGGGTSSTRIPDKSRDKVTSVLTAFPNPATNVLRFNLNNGSYTSYKVLNKLGQVVINSEGTETSNQISIEKLSAGTYFLNVIDEQNIPHSVKFVKL